MLEVAAVEDASLERVRLHITPFNRDLLDKIIPPAVQPLAHNLSFHAVQTFPERGFGYVELPAMEAQKIKKKLNGSTLRGAKVRIEAAKPERKRKSDQSEEDGEARKARRTEKKKGKQRGVDGVIPGRELEEGRRVKRGWTEKGAGSKDSRKTEKAVSTGPDERDSGLEGKKLRFKTNVPPNASVVDGGDGGGSKKSKRGKIHKDATGKTVVEEFTTSSAPKADESHVSSSSPPSFQYEDGRGWIDEAGETVDAEPKSRARRSNKARPEGERRISAIESRETDDLPVSYPATSPDVAVQDESILTDAATAEHAAGAEPMKAVHPLEALFKKPASKDSSGAKSRPQPIDTSFSFFDAPAADDEGMAVDLPPQTPHTKRDLEWRSVRSAAPTPDTAAIGRKFSFPFARGSQEAEDDADAVLGNLAGERDVGMADAAPPGAAATTGATRGQGEESAFRKWFYENRGDLNRGWKKRRREEKKAERQRENRRLSRKVA